jgi:outer membrane protein assembly factor BamD (BamD/ComL family)
MKRFLRPTLCILSSAFLALTGCSTTFDAADAFKGESPQQIYAKGVEALRDKNYQNAIKRLNVLKHWMCNILTSAIQKKLSFI